MLWPNAMADPEIEFRVGHFTGLLRIFATVSHRTF
jgi:hypothetical protein